MSEAHSPSFLVRFFYRKKIRFASVRFEASEARTWTKLVNVKSICTGERTTVLRQRQPTKVVELFFYYLVRIGMDKHARALLEMRRRRRTRRATTDGRTEAKEESGLFRSYGGGIMCVCVYLALPSLVPYLSRRRRRRPASVHQHQSLLAIHRRRRRFAGGRGRVPKTEKKEVRW